MKPVILDLYHQIHCTPEERHQIQSLIFSRIESRFVIKAFAALLPLKSCPICQDTARDLQPKLSEAWGAHLPLSNVPMRDAVIVFFYTASKWYPYMPLLRASQQMVYTITVQYKDHPLVKNFVKANDHQWSHFVEAYPSFPGLYTNFQAEEDVKVWVEKINRQTSNLYYQIPFAEFGPYILTGLFEGFMHFFEVQGQVNPHVLRPNLFQLELIQNESRLHDFMT